MSAKQRAMFGGVAWIVAIAFLMSGFDLHHAAWAHGLLLLAALVLVPLA